MKEPPDALPHPTPAPPAPQEARTNAGFRCFWCCCGLIVLCTGLAGCSAQAADAPATTAADLKRAAAGAWLCPGMAAVWLDEVTVQCLKEKP